MSQVKQKYLKDQDGEIFSPITSSDSVYHNGKKLSESLPTKLSQLTNDIFIEATSESDAISKSVNGKLAYWRE